MISDFAINMHFVQIYTSFSSFSWNWIMLQANLNYSVILGPVTKAVFPGPFPSQYARKGTADGGDLTCPGRKRVLW